MTPKPKASTSTSQTAKFKKAARDLGCDEDGAAFDERLKKIAKAKPSEKDRPHGKGNR
jgi:hypothetical protein